ncbi:MAG: hypothetical protein WCV59_03220 [Parcubacteria group bacterium]
MMQAKSNGLQGVIFLKITNLQVIVENSRFSVVWKGYGIDLETTLDTLEKIKTPEKFGMRVDEVDRRVGYITAQLEMMGIITPEQAEAIMSYGCY